MDSIDALFEEQGQSCAICKRHWTACERAKNSRHDSVFLQHLYVDHCHATAKVRGLLCNKCNTAIAMFDEDLDRLDAAKMYVMPHRTT